MAKKKGSDFVLVDFVVDESPQDLSNLDKLYPDSSTSPAGEKIVHHLMQLAYQVDDEENLFQVRISHIAQLVKDPSIRIAFSITNIIRIPNIKKYFSKDSNGKYSIKNDEHSIFFVIDSCIAHLRAAEALALKDKTRHYRYMSFSRSKHMLVPENEVSITNS